MTLPAPLVRLTVLGSRYELMILEAGLDERVACVSLMVGDDGNGVPAGALDLLPDETRALAAELVLWAGHAERHGRGRAT